MQGGDGLGIHAELCFRPALAQMIVCDVEILSEYFRAGKGNREMGGLLSGLLGNRVDTTELSTGTLLSARPRPDDRL